MSVKRIFRHQGVRDIHFVQESFELWYKEESYVHQIVKS